MKKISLLVSGLIIFAYLGSTAQQIDSTMAKYVSNFPQEKVHIHFDKGVYFKGETIWLKAYILAGLDLSDYSKNFYVDWYSDKGKLIKHTVNPIFESTAKGQFNIPENYTGKYLHAKAYTKWMLNFDTAFLYNKDIRIDQLGAGNTARGQINRTKTTADSSTATFPTPKIPKVSIHFFPEGGDMVVGIYGRVAFLAENEFGFPVRAKGVIKNSKGRFVDSMKTEHDGMGSITIEADIAQQYTATWIDEYGEMHTNTLPQAKEKGAVLRVQQADEKVIFSATRSSLTDSNLQKLYVIGHMFQNQVFKSTITLREKLSGKGEVSTKEMPTGVLQVTLFDAMHNPLAERVVFINNHEYGFRPAIRATKKGFGKREKNTVEIEVDDSLLCNMSVSVTDADVLIDSVTTIASDLLLSGDVKGYIHNAAQYMTSDDDSMIHYLDLVMMTHGWRRFNWKEVVAGKMPSLTYPKETEFMQLKGTVYGAPDRFALRNENILLILKGKESSNQTLMMTIDKNNDFVQKDIFLIDTTTVYYQMTGSKSMVNRMEIRFQTGLLSAMPGVYSGTTADPFLWSYNGTDSVLLAKARVLYNENQRIKKQLQGHELQSVTVKTRVKRKEDILDEKYATGLFAGGDNKRFDITDEPTAQALQDVFTYLQGRVAGLIISNTGANVSLLWRGSTPDLYLDQMKVDASQLKTISMTNVAYVKVFSPPFFGSFGGGGSGAIAVYTRRGGDVKSAPGDGLSSQIVTGYTFYKEFYQPDYRIANNESTDDDARSTLYWNPYILTDKKRKTVQIMFYNNDFSKKFRLVLEGINSEGRMARVVKMIE